MQKRADLIKRLELGVQQEIKNYNDSLSTILLRLNYLKEDIESAERESLENDAILLSKLKEVELNFNLVRDARDDSVRKMNRDITVLSQKFEAMQTTIDVSLANSLEAARKNEYNANTIDALSTTMDTLRDEIEGHSSFIKSELERLSYQLRKDVQKAKEEINSKPSEIPEVKKQLEEKINSHAVDVDGLLKEIRTTNKSIMILEKKIQNLYTLVGRLQKEGTP